MEVIVYGIVVFFGLFAWQKESLYRKDSFYSSYPKKKTTLVKSFRNIKNAPQLHRHIVKWRISLLFAILNTFFIYLFYYQRFPSAKEILLVISLTMSLFLLFWEYITNEVSSSAETVVDSNIEHIRKLRRRRKHKVGAK